MNNILLAHNGVQDGHPDATGEPETIDTTITATQQTVSPAAKQSSKLLVVGPATALVILAAVIFIGRRLRRKRQKNSPMGTQQL